MVLGVEGKRERSNMVALLLNVANRNRSNDHRTRFSFVSLMGSVLVH